MSDLYEKAKQEIVRELRKDRSLGKDDLENIKRNIASKYKLERVPSNPEIMSELDEETKAVLEEKLSIKRTRSASGVVVVAAMTAPFGCPHGTCLYCPGGPSFGTPQSYTGHEPAAMRAIQNDFDPHKQVVERLRQLGEMGHSTQKVELIIMGGTFTYLPVEYQRWFIKSCFDALNGIQSNSIEEAHSIAEKSSKRNVGLTLETRPDYCRAEHVDVMLDLGATRVELGLQSLSDDVLRLIKRGHTVEDSIRAIRLCKDSGLKVCVHMMPGLPGSDYERDIEGFEMLFEDHRFRPDMMKIYPTLVIEGTGLYSLYKSGNYSPLTDEGAVKLVAEVMSKAPRWLRMMRVQRDIPAQYIVAGPRHGNLRESAMEYLRRTGSSTLEMRSREFGIRGGLDRNDEIVLRRTDYDASGGREIFLEYVGSRSDTLIAHLRLRLPSKDSSMQQFRNGNSAIVRELKVVGRSTPLGMVYERSAQHRGLGASLVNEAERIAREEWHLRKLYVISAIGTREYYHRLGYITEAPYVSKELLR